MKEMVTDFYNKKNQLVFRKIDLGGSFRGSPYTTGSNINKGIEILEYLLNNDLISLKKCIYKNKQHGKRCNIIQFKSQINSKYCSNHTCPICLNSKSSRERICKKM
mgnify:CR=1 FL=1|jgi:hypothetical protein